jgi:hypothetical protein
MNILLGLMLWLGGFSLGGIGATTSNVWLMIFVRQSQGGFMILSNAVRLFLWGRDELTPKERHWLIRRSRDKTGIGIPDDVKDRIVALGYGEPEGLYSFRLTKKGQQYLAGM